VAGLGHVQRDTGFLAYVLDIDKSTHIGGKIDQPVLLADQETSGAFLVAI
jgi:hypothetical protein